MLVEYIDTISLYILLFFCFYAIYFVLSSKFLAYPPFVISSKKLTSIIVETVSKYIKEKNSNKPLTIMDAGCGTGTLIIPLAKDFPNHNFIGVEWSFLPYLIARYKTRNIQNVTIIRKDMFKYDFAKVNIVICFLIGHIMQRFSDKCQKELKSGSYIFSSKFRLKDMKAIEEVDLGKGFSYLHIYKIDDKKNEKS